MKYLYAILMRPGIYLYTMFLWIIPFAIRDICFFEKHNIAITRAIMNIYVIPYCVCFIIASILNLIFSRLWKKMNFWAKYLILIGAYFIAIWGSSILTVILHEHGYVDYSGDIFGTIVMMYLPTFFLYMICGIPLILFFKGKIKGKN
jgi:hypothetical protein